jgi:hypothetical protein
MHVFVLGMYVSGDYSAIGEYIGNYIGPEGASAIASAIRVSTTVKSLDLSGEGRI